MGRIINPSLLSPSEKRNAVLTRVISARDRLDMARRSMENHNDNMAKVHIGLAKDWLKQINTLVDEL